MAVTYSRAGRPCFVADISPSEDRHIVFWDEFARVCSAFCYRDIVAVSRYYGLTINAVERWKYGLNFPIKERAEDVIGWVNGGKPMKQRRPFPVNAGML